MGAVGMFRDHIDRFRLGRVERKLKRLRVEQRDARQEIKDLEAQRSDGVIPPDEYEARLEELEERKSRITQEIHDLREQQQELEESLAEA